MFGSRSIARVLTAFALCSVPFTVAAQNMGGAVGFNNVTNSICGGSCERAAERQDRFVDREALAQIFAGRPSTPDTSQFDFSYTPSPERTQRNIRSFVESSPNASARADMQRMFGNRPGLMNEFRQALAPYGLDSHDVADAYTTWLINVWLVANKRDEDPDNATVAMVKQQARAAFAAQPGFSGTNDAQRQEFAEMLLLQAFLLDSGFNQLKSDPALLNQFASAVAQGAAARGFDVSRFSLTSEGFVPR